MLPGSAFSEASITPSSITIYRQVMPDGKVIYSDKEVKGGKVDHTLTIEKPIPGNLWSTEPGSRPTVLPPSESTPIRKVNTLPGIAKKKLPEQISSDVIRAEMLVEDAKKRQAAGIEPLAGERSDNGRLNGAYASRQTMLARDVRYAEEQLKKAQLER
jgi:hypothetical protein